MRTSAAVAVACLATLAMAADDAAAAPKKETTITAQGLGPALQQLARERDVQLVYRSELVGDRQTSGAVGEFTLDEALTNLLKGTGLTYQYIDDTALTIVPLSTQQSGTRNQSLGSPQGLWDRFRVAQAETPAPGRAQTVGFSSDDSTKRITLEEVIVTAQKREESLKDVPISISVLGGDQLDSSRVQGITEALSRVPGVALQENQQGGGTQLIVRGITTLALFNGPSPVAFYADTIPFGFVGHALAPDANAYDLDRIEVLRGPQGTLYGAGGMGGVVRVLSHDADLDRFEFKGRTSISSTTGGSESYRGDMAVNVPLIDDKLAIRAVAGYNDVGGWVEGPNTKDINDAQLANYRLRLNAQPTDHLNIKLFTWLSRNDYEALALSNDDGEFNSDLGQPTSTDFSAYGASLSYNFPAFTVTSSTSYIDFSNDGDQDLDWLFVGALGQAPGNRLITLLNSRVFSQEVRFDSTTESLWEWSFGGIYRDAKDHIVQPFIAPTGVSINQDDTAASESYAVFGEVNRWLLRDRLKLTGGLRYFHDDTAVQGEVFAAPIDPQTGNYQATTPRVVLTWLPSSDRTVYASYAQGFRSGFINIGLGFPPAEPDKVHNYEIGTKVGWLDHRASLDFALYYTDWQDIQQSIVVSQASGLFGPIVTNGGSASGLGVDLALSVMPVDGLTLGVAGGWNDLTYDHDVFGDDGSLQYQKGHRIDNSPEYTASAFADYSFPLGGGFEGRASAGLNYTSGRNSFTFAAPSVASSPLLVGSAGFSVDAPKHWSATLYAENVNNEQDAVYAGLVPEWSGRVRPRTIGLQFEYHY